MKHLSRKHKIALVELVVLVLLVVWFIAPRPLTRAMAGDGFDPAAVTQIQADLTAFQGGEGRTLTFSQGEPAFSQLMDLLQSKRYIPYYLDQDAQRSVTLGYRVDLTFSQGEASYTLSLTGHRHGRRWRDENLPGDRQRRLSAIRSGLSPGTGVH